MNNSLIEPLIAGAVHLVAAKLKPGEAVSVSAIRRKRAELSRDISIHLLLGISHFFAAIDIDAHCKVGSQ